MSKRLNDTAAVATMVPYESASDHYSRTVRKIDNGFITSHYSSGPNDPAGPTSKEVFTPHHPDANEEFGHGNSMKRAVSFMKNC